MTNKIAQDYIVSNILLFLKETQKDTQSMPGFHYAYMAILQMLHLAGHACKDITESVTRFYNGKCPKSRKVLVERLTRAEGVFHMHYMQVGNYPSREDTIDLICELYAKVFDDILIHRIPDFNDVQCSDRELVPAILRRPLSESQLNCLKEYWLAFYNDPERYNYVETIQNINEFLDDTASM